jgi:hypothetical protein
MIYKIQKGAKLSADIDDGNIGFAESDKCAALETKYLPADTT